MTNLWKELPKPFFALAPMEEVTDTVFRQIVTSCYPPNVYFTEFTNCEGLQSDGFEKVSQRLKFTQKEQPLVAQVWGITPDDYFKSAKLITEMGFAGLDINMGCPVKKIIQKGACSALIKNPSLALEIIQATKEGLQGKIPLSIKTRIGFDQITTENWIGFLLEKGKPNCLTIHGRTVKEESKVPNHWEEIAKAVEFKNTISPATIIIGNGDIDNYQMGVKKAKELDLDGIMIGRAVFQNLWIFDPNNPIISPLQKLTKLEEHIQLFFRTWGESKNYSVLKRFFKIYVHGFDKSKDLRARLMETKTFTESLQILEEAKNTLKFL